MRTSSPIQRSGTHSAATRPGSAARVAYAILFLGAAATQLGATDCGQIIKDDGFDHWCGDRLCYWTVERGDVARVPTWHVGDDGVEFVGSDVAISQLTPVTSRDTNCIRFEMVADVAETAEVRLEADVFDDGTIDWSERIPTSSWQRLSLLLGFRGSYEGIRFRLTKVGAGRAVLAQIAAEVSDVPCPTLVDPVGRPLGAACLDGADCELGLCTGFVCSECASGAECDDGAVCGKVEDWPAHLAPWHACVAPAARALGEPCFVDEECATGVCTGALCGECASSDDCGGAACAWASEDPFVPVRTCASADRATGEPCVLDADCASGACDGRPLGTCGAYGLTPCFEDDDCPVSSDLEPTACTFWAVAGGTCQ